MSEDSLPLEQWPAGIQQASVPANENALRVQALLSRALSVENDAPGTEYNGAVYIVGDTPAGAFANFAEHDIALYEYDSWYAWSPVLGTSMVIADDRMVFDGTEWIADPSVGGGGGGGGARDTVTALATSGAVAIDVSLGDYFTLALSGDVTGFTFSGLPGSGKGATIAIRITQDSTARTVAWPASFRWAGGVAPSVSTSSGAVDFLVISTFDNGTTWQADLAKGYA